MKLHFLQNLSDVLEAEGNRNLLEIEIESYCKYEFIEICLVRALYKAFSMARISLYKGTCNVVTTCFKSSYAS